MPYLRRFHTDLQAYSEVIVLQCYFCRKNGLADRTSKSKSIAFKSKSESLEPKSKYSKNGLKSGLESKSGLEY